MPGGDGGMVCLQADGADELDPVGDRREPGIVVKESSAQCQWSVFPPKPRYLTSESANSIP